MVDVIHLRMQPTLNGLADPTGTIGYILMLLDSLSELHKFHAYLLCDDGDDVSERLMRLHNLTAVTAGPAACFKICRQKTQHNTSYNL